jgi:hypothetical protein
MLKNVNEDVEEGEIIGQYKAFWGLINRVFKSPIKGSIELISDLSGQVVIREPPVPLEVKAYIHGRVTKVLPNEGVVIQTPAAFIQGVFGISGETVGEIMVMSDSDEILTAEKINPDCTGKILITKTSADIKALRKAVEVGVKGIVSGGINERDLIEFMGYELGVVITGQEEVGLTLIITEGFGEKMRMSEKTFQLLKKFEGKQTSMSGATQIRAGVIRPEIIVPQSELDSKELVEYDVEDTEVLAEGLTTGTLIRIISEPYFGAFGKITKLPPELHVQETESKVRILEAELEDGRRVIVARANVEIIGE